MTFLCHCYIYTSQTNESSETVSEQLKNHTYNTKELKKIPHNKKKPPKKKKRKNIIINSQKKTVPSKPKAVKITPCAMTGTDCDKQAMKCQHETYKEPQYKKIRKSVYCDHKKELNRVKCHDCDICTI